MLGSYSSLTELLDQDVSSYEYFYSLPPEMQEKIKKQDLSSFDDLLDYVESQSDYREFNQ